MDRQPSQPPPQPPAKKPYERPKIVKIRAVDTATLFVSGPMMMMGG